MAAKPIANESVSEYVLDSYFGLGNVSTKAEVLRGPCSACIEWITEENFRVSSQSICV